METYNRAMLSTSVLILGRTVYFGIFSDVRVNNMEASLGEGEAPQLVKLVSLESSILAS